jgi:isopentenyl diphosphate isomerase/L-lactate dehydrogenase-like FMN-dependent dehydrogenase
MSDRPGKPVPSFGMQRQLAIFTEGVAGKKPERPTGFESMRREAQKVMSPEAYGYVTGGAGAETTMRANLEVFHRWRIVPRMLRGVSHPDLSTEVLGQRLRAPVMLAPVGVLSICHPDAELGVARAAASLDVPMVLSTVSSTPMEAVSEAMDGHVRWFQLYWSRDREFAASLLQRAEAAGYGAIVVTLDTFQLAWRPRDLDHGYLPFLHGEGLGNYLTDPVFRSGLERPPEEDPRAVAMRFAELFTDPTLTWDDLSFLRETTKLPIVLKGIQHPDDARQALDRGMDGVIVSNHGGRQVDGALASLDALPGVVEAIGGRAPVLFDSGIRQASDVFRAIALGASAVLVGRPYAYALGLGGEEGVRDFLHNFLAELDLTLSLAGCASIADIGPDSVVRK